MNRFSTPKLQAIGVLLSAASGLFALPLACSNDPGFGEGEGPACNNPALSSECGKDCDVTEDCAPGLFCDDRVDTCQAECVAGSLTNGSCDGRACTEDGRCVGGIGDGDPGFDLGQGGALGTGGTNQDCIDLVVDFSPQTPNVVLLIDQSGSMNDAQDFGEAVEEEIDAGMYTPWGCPENGSDPLDDPNQDNPTWRWNVVRNVLFNPDSGVVKPLEDEVRFGMALYTSVDGGPSCPNLTEVDLAFGTHADMLAAMDCNDISEDTPTRESLTAIAEALDAQDLDGTKVIVLATDGEPDNCTCPDWGNDGGEDCGDDQPFVERGGEMMSLEMAERYDVVQEAARIRDELGIVVHVIDVSTPSNTTLRAHLTEVAEAGGGDIFDGTNPSGLTDAFQSIIDGVRSCAIDLDGEIEPGKEDTGTVTLNGAELVLDGADGFRVNTPTQIELLGAACEAIKSGSPALDISFPCGSFTPPGPK